MILPLLNFLKDFMEREHNQINKVYAKLCFDILAKQYQSIIIC